MVRCPKRAGQRVGDESDRSGRRVYAYGIRNAVTIAVCPETGVLWGSVNERDQLGDKLPPDYITDIEDGGFYGWPWYYIGANWTPGHQGKDPELKIKSWCPTCWCSRTLLRCRWFFMRAGSFPREYHGDIFAAQHGSWNRRHRAGYQVVRVPVQNATRWATMKIFSPALLLPMAKVWGRPVGIAVGNDGSSMSATMAPKSSGESATPKMNLYRWDNVRRLQSA